MGGAGAFRCPDCSPTMTPLDLLAAAAHNVTE
jgi:hypothetical protein